MKAPLSVVTSEFVPGNRLSLDSRWHTAGIICYQVR